MMTKKHFIALAKALASCRPKLDSIEHSSARLQWEACMNAIIDCCILENQNFKKEVFRSACYQ